MTPIIAETEILPTRQSKRGEPTWEIAHLYPEQGAWTEDEYLDLALNTKRLIELSDGVLEFLPMPHAYHQLIVRLLFRLLDTFVVGKSLGEVLFAPLPVRLFPGEYREPDIIFVQRERLRERIPNVPKAMEGADLALEAVSEGSDARTRDLETKRQKYAEARIAEYWIVDAEQRRITVLTLDGQSYRVHGDFGPGTEASSVLLPGFGVSVDAVFASGVDLD
jgi:Uma2 family endonuclease